MFFNKLVLLFFFLTATHFTESANNRRDEVNDHDMHPQFQNYPHTKNVRANELEGEMQYWRSQAQDILRAKIQSETSLNTNRAKNIIMFLGDGLSLSTVAATRMYLGAEEEQLSFEKFPHFGLSKVCLIGLLSTSSIVSTESHAGDDVGVYASGPWSHLFVGAYEQSNIPIYMAFAAKIGPYVDDEKITCGADSLKLPVAILIGAFLIKFLF